MIFPHACITPFSMGDIQAEEETLVIEGDIILNGETKVYLSFLETIGAEYDQKYVTGATVWVESTSGNSYTGSAVNEANSLTCFLVDTRALSIDGQYKLCVALSNGRRFESDWLTPLPTPDIGSIEYIVNNTHTAVDFVVTSFGNSDDSPYYKWNYTEDWEIVSAHRSNVYYDRVRNMILEYPTPLPVYYCWGQSKSSSILIARTDHLADNTVYRHRLNSLTNVNYKISQLYSMELYQMSISKEAFVYWSNLKRNTDEIGGLFPPQPNDLYGNIHCISDPGVRTIGYISAGTLSVKRIFVSEEDIGIYVPRSCNFLDMTQFLIPPTDMELFDWGFQIVGMELIMRERRWVPISCVDCRVLGTKNKPSFWPNDHT